MGPKVGVTLLTVGATVISILKTEKNLTLLPVYNSNIKVSAEPLGLFSFEMDTQDSGCTPNYQYMMRFTLTIFSFVQYIVSCVKNLINVHLTGLYLFLDQLFLWSK